MGKRCIHELIACVLTYLDTQRNGCDNYTHVMHACMIDTRTMRKVVDLLDQLGFIKKVYTKSTHIICITDEGRKFKNDLNKVITTIRRVLTESSS